MILWTLFFQQAAHPGLRQPFHLGGIVHGYPVSGSGYPYNVD